MSASHPTDQTLTELLAHLDAEHGWAEDRPDDRCDYCEAPGTDTYSFRDGFGRYTQDLCVDCASRAGRRAF